MRIDPAAKAEIEAKARERNLTVTDYLTRAGLGRATRQRADVDAINELRSCADELRSMHHALQKLSNGELLIAPETMDAQMAAITRAIQRVWNNGGNE